MLRESGGGSTPEWTGSRLPSKFCTPSDRLISVSVDISDMGFNPHDPIDPLEQSVPYELQQSSPPAPFDPVFQSQLQTAPDSVLRRAEEQAQFANPGLKQEISDELMRRHAPAPEPAPSTPSTTGSTTPSLSDEEKAALEVAFVSTTALPLSMVDPDDYKHKCKYCDDEVRPFSEGPHHESSCRRHAPFLRFDATQAHDKKCRHCSARPFVAGFHHKADCPRGFPAVTPWDVERDDHGNKCKHCGVRPFSEGPHHDEDCSRHAGLPLFHTDLAHKYHCTHCEARPFTAGPHHKKSCQRHVDKLAIPVPVFSAITG